MTSAECATRGVELAEGVRRDSTVAEQRPRLLQGVGEALLGPFVQPDVLDEFLDRRRS